MLGFFCNEMVKYLQSGVGEGVTGGVLSLDGAVVRVTLDVDGAAVCGEGVTLDVDGAAV